MKHLSLRVLFLCVFLPPVLYIYTIQGLEIALQHLWEADLRGRLITSPQELLAGRKSIREEIGINIDNYLESLWLVKLGAEPRVQVSTDGGQVIYPAVSTAEEYSFEYSADMGASPDSSDLSVRAQENVRILQEGLNYSLQVRIPRNTWLANIILLIYIFLFATVLSFSYRARAREIEKAARQREQDLEDARERLSLVQARLRETSDREKSYRQEVDRQQQELIQADQRLQSTEDVALAEMESLEEKLQKSMAEKQEQEQEMLVLLEEVERLKSVQQGTSRKKNKQYENISKRFKVLYKNIDFHGRALEGFLQLPGDLELKAEEMVHTLDQDCSLVKVKRKVFSGKGSDLPALESIFAYRGRIYWRKKEDTRIEVMAIGTKNTQNKDMAYLEGLG